MRTKHGVKAIIGAIYGQVHGQIVTESPSMENRSPQGPGTVHLLGDRKRPAPGGVWEESWEVISGRLDREQGVASFGFRHCIRYWVA